ncbi:MAG: SPFH domain-containing protein [Lachnospiraceae bacterium]|nr:SPFH domain-containing protein [Parasporobacterium sp.]MBR4169249.1 SPFH domain-containing protein [Lachnospiraceae bacterium]
MGLISAITAAAGSALADSWREYFYCESMSADVMIVKGNKRTGGKSSNTKGSDNLISNGSIIAVNDGQCMLIVEQGKVVEVCAEPGEFVWDSSTEPSIFYGSLGENIKKSFMQIGRRFTFGGDTAKDQRVYYVNTKELVGNKYGTANPVPFRVVDKNVGLDVDISIRCHGEYSYKIVDPVLFYTNVAGNVTDKYTRDKIDSQLKSELMTALQPAFAKISDMGIRYSALPGHTEEIADALNDVLSQKWGELRGLAIVSFGVNSVTASEEDAEMIKTMQTMTNPAMAAARLTAAQANAMESAASNTSAGPMMAFAGMNMANNAGGMNASNLYAMAAQQQQAAPAAAAPAAAPAAGGWTCACGHTGNTGKFCAECGAPQPSADGWTCTCGTVNKGKFCQNCGAKKPAGAPVYKCDKCGWEPEDKTNPPKFCPECGDPFDDDDVQ